MYKTTLSDLWHVRYTKKNCKFREQALPFHLETTIVILVTLSIYSCVTNVTLEITSKRHQTNYGLDWIIIKRASETTAGDSRWLFISTNPAIQLKIWGVLFSEATSKRRLIDSFVNKRLYIFYYYRLIGLKCNNYALYLSFIYIHIYNFIWIVHFLANLY